MRRINGTSLSDEEWAKRLCASFRRAAKRAGNDFIADWYNKEANELQDLAKISEDKSISSEIEENYA